MTIPFSSWVKGNVLVPDIIQFVEQGLILKQNELEHILVPSHVVAGISTYAIRAVDGSYQFTDIATLASGLMRELTIGDRKYYDKWQIDQNKYHRALVSMFIICAIMRTDRTQTITAAFKELKTLSNNGFFGSLCGDLSKYFKRFIAWVCGDLPKEEMQAQKIPSLDDFHLNKFRYVYLEDVIINGSAKAMIESLPGPGPLVYAKTPKYSLEIGSKIKSVGKAFLGTGTDGIKSIKKKMLRTKYTVTGGPSRLRRKTKIDHTCPVCLTVTSFWSFNPADAFDYTCSCGNVCINIIDTDSSSSGSRSSSASSRTRSPTPATRPISRSRSSSRSSATTAPSRKSSRKSPHTKSTRATSLKIRSQTSASDISTSTNTTTTTSTSSSSSSTSPSSASLMSDFGIRHRAMNPDITPQATQPTTAPTTQPQDQSATTQPSTAAIQPQPQVAQPEQQPQPQPQVTTVDQPQAPPVAQPDQPTATPASQVTTNPQQPPLVVRTGTGTLKSYLNSLKKK